MLRTCRLSLIGLAPELGVFAGRTDGARADHECFDGDRLDGDVGLMIVVFEIPLWVTTGNGKAERRLAAHACGVGTLLDEHRCQFQNQIEAGGVGFVDGVVVVMVTMVVDG